LTFFSADAFNASSNAPRPAHASPSTRITSNQAANATGAATASRIGGIVPSATAASIEKCRGAIQQFSRIILYSDSKRDS
jgi:hypothetical protein